MSSVVLERTVPAEPLITGAASPSLPSAAAPPSSMSHASYLPHFLSVDDLVEELRPTAPVFCLRREAITALAARFVSAFPGRTLYAVKCNPHPFVLESLFEAGIRDFDELMEKVSSRAPARRLVTIEEVGAACVFLASDYGAAMTGETLYVDGGAKI